ncbi:hypothetical protein EDD22DRAFT_954534 [Suillus occidentalis]|nr:hypothetical protein EDD22DRAFT_954534 [Suillus occidentalis]
MSSNTSLSILDYPGLHLDSCPPSSDIPSCSLSASDFVLAAFPLLPISGFSSHASDMVLDEFLQFQISHLDFPTLFQKSFGLFHQSYLTFRVQLNFVGCLLDFILKCGACTRVRGTAYELRPSPSFLILPSNMVLNKKYILTLCICL